MSQLTQEERQLAIVKIIQTLELRDDTMEALMNVIAAMPEGTVWDAAVVVAMTAAWTAQACGRDMFEAIFDICFEASGDIAARKKRILACSVCGAKFGESCDTAVHERRQ